MKYPRSFPRARLPLAALLILGAAAGAAAQSRDTICLHEASELCGDLLAGQSAAERRLVEIGDARLQRACRSVLAREFYRGCAQRYLATPAADRRCTRIFKQFERNYARAIRSERAAGLDTGRCS
jgi:hypothetical protein